MRKIFLSSLALGLSAGLVSADTIVQSCNRTVSFDAPPARAISNDVNLTEMMLVLGLADRMVGYTGISGWKTLDEEMRAGIEALPELSAKYPTKEVLVGADADLVVWDPEKGKTIAAGSQQSAIDYNVFEGKEVKGLPRYTLTRGRVAVEDGTLKPKEGHGEFVKREPVNAVNKALSTWKELTSPRKVERTGIPASGV